MTDESRSTLAFGTQGPLIDAAWKQVAGLNPSSSASRRLRSQTLAALPPDSFPGYRVIEEVYRGGQGVVYKAVQESTQQEVAIKLLREAHLLGQHDVARFEQEVRILGRLRHPNIVRIFDSRVAEGRLYYVMDYIAGRPLDEFVREQHPAVPQIAALFVRICDAVNTAHLHGVIHRDLKPGNIRINDEGEPFVLDFGLSKLAGEGDSSVTQTGQFVGSAPWASPEQAAGQVHAIDLRTDVYSLGVLLYQMVTGEFPYPLRRSIPEILQTIIDTAPSLPRSHNTALSADLETILLKCLQKDPARRYQSAGELGRDLARYLAGEPIEARRDSLAYVLRKQLARHKLAAVGSGAFLLVLVGGLIASLTFWQQAEAARRTAENQSAIASHQEQTARSQAELAARESAKAKAVADFLKQMIVSVNPYEGGARDVRVVDTLEAARKRLREQALTSEPALEAQVQMVLGQSYAALAMFDTATELLGAALQTFERTNGNLDPETIEARLRLAVVWRAQDRLDEAEAGFGAALSAAEQSLGRDSELATAALNELGGLLGVRGAAHEAEAVLREALALRIAKHGPDHAEVGRTTNDLALVLLQLDRFDEAEELLKRAIEITERVRGPDDPARSVQLANLARLYADRGRLDDADELYRQVLPIVTRVLGEHNPQMATFLNSYGNLCRLKERYDEAEGFFRRALELNLSLHGPLHASVAANRHNLAIVLLSLGRPDEAAPQIAAAIDIFCALRGPEHDSVLSGRMVLAAIQRARGDLDAAEAELRLVAAAQRNRRGDDSSSTLSALGNLGMVLYEKDELDEAEAIFETVLEKRQALLGDEHPETVSSRERLANCLHMRGRLDEAEALMRGVRESYRGRGNTVSVARTSNQLGLILGAAHRLEEAEVAFCDATTIGGTVLPDAHPDLCLFRINHGLARYRLGEKQDGLDQANAAIQTLVATQGETHPYVRDGREKIARVVNEKE